MVRYWLSALHEAIVASFGTIQQSWFGLLYLAIAFSIGAALVYHIHGLEAFREHLIRNVFEVIAAAVLAWFPFFGFHLLQVPVEWQKAADLRAHQAESERKKAEDAVAGAQVRIRELEKQIAEKPDGAAERQRRRQVRDRLGALIIAGQKLMDRCVRNDNNPPPQAEADQWATEVHKFLQSQLEASFDARFLSPPAPLPISHPGLSSANDGLWRGINAHVEVLRGFISELHD